MDGVFARVASHRPTSERGRSRSSRCCRRCVEWRCCCCPRCSYELMAPAGGPDVGRTSEAERSVGSFRAMVPYLDAPHGAESGLWSGIVDASRQASCAPPRTSRVKASMRLLPQRCIDFFTSPRARRGAVSRHLQIGSAGVTISTSFALNLDRQNRR